MRLDFEINDVRLSDEFMVVPYLSEEVIIGVTTMQKWRIKLHYLAGHRICRSPRSKTYPQTYNLLLLQSCLTLSGF